MQNKLIAVLALLIMCTSTQVKAQYAKQDSTFKRYFLGSTLFVLVGALSTSNKPDFAQLNFGYRLTGKDVVSLELKTWKYAWSLGIPYGPLREAPETEFPGFIREAGFALAYQRFWWKGLYTGIHVMSAWQRFVDSDGTKVGKGFQFFNTYRLGYHVKLFNDRFFIEPSIAITHRPYLTDMPAGFKQIDDQYSRFFYGEPGFH
ncbi:MAG: hypothetical protein AAFV07_19725, partial [Bacteroidota bacterium]